MVNQLHYQEQGWPVVLRAEARGDRVIRAATDVLPIGECDTAAIGQAVPFYREWLAHPEPGDPWWEPVDFGRRLGGVPPASLIAGWYDLFCPAQVADYQALRRAGRTARLTIGPWTPSSPGLLAEAVRDGPEWWAEQLGTGRAPSPAPCGSSSWARGRGRSSPCGRRQGRRSGGTSGAGGPLGPESPEASGPDRYRYDPAGPPLPSVVRR